MKSTIETYRGIEIWFDTDLESFQCDIDDERSVKKAYKPLKKFIDDYLKENNDFKPFSIECAPNGYGVSDKFIRIVGIRKDGRFIMEDKDGNKDQLSEYDEKDYMLVNPDNKQLWLELEKIKSEREQLNQREKEVKDKFKIVTVKDVKPNYLPK